MKRRATGSLSKFDELRKTKGNAADRLKSYKVKEEDDAYEEVDEETYDAIMKKKFEEDDFVEDDDGRGYVDDGLGNMDEGGCYSEEDEAEDEDMNARGKKGGKKQKEKRQRKVKPEARITTFFHNQVNSGGGGVKQETPLTEPMSFATKATSGRPLSHHQHQSTASIAQQQQQQHPSSSVSVEDLMAGIFGVVDNNIESMLLESMGGSRSEVVGGVTKAPPAQVHPHSFAGHASGTVASSLMMTTAKPSSVLDNNKADTLVDESSYNHDLEFDQVQDDGAAVVASSDDGRNGDVAVVTDAANVAALVETKSTETTVEPEAKAAAAVTKVTATTPPVIPVTAPRVVAAIQKQKSSSATYNTSRSFKPVATPATVGAASALASSMQHAGMDLGGGFASEAGVLNGGAIHGSGGGVSLLQVGGGGSGSGIGGINGEEFFEEDGILRMYWFDAYEMGGTVYLFGKAHRKGEENGKENYVSCCVTIKGIVRVLFVLPRTKKLENDVETDEDVSCKDVYREFDQVRKKYKVISFKSKIVSRKYAFELPGVPIESDYLKVTYPYSENALPQDISGSTFSRVFGTNVSALENFLIKRKLMGPGWIEIKDAKLSNRNVSWAKLEFTVDSPKYIRPLLETEEGFDKRAPPLNVMSLNFRFVMNHSKKSNEIVAASMLVFQNVPMDNSPANIIPKSFNAIRQLTDVPLPHGIDELAAELRNDGKTVEILRNEKALLNYLIAVLHRNDPDVIVGHNIVGNDLGILLHRLKENKVDTWSKLGRLRRTKWPKLGGTGDNMFHERQIVSGRLLCDTFMSSKEYVMKVKSYTLSSMAETQLNIRRDELEFENIPKMFWDAAQMMWLVRHCETDAHLVSMLMFKLNVLPLTKQLTNLAGNLWSRTIMAGSRADRNEYLLLHEFHNKKYIKPDKVSRQPRHFVDVQKDDDDDDQPIEKSTSSRKKPAYAGGLVLEPRVGFYDKFVLLLDFNSLYPSIIQEFNICFTTVERGGVTDGEENVPCPPEPETPQGILPRLLATLVERRRQVKSLLKAEKDPARKAEFDVRQLALKLTANSMYGCLGFVHSRFYAKPLAMLVTAKGREILQATVDLATQEKLDVIYGDTDSIMIYTHSETVSEVMKIGNMFKQLVNKRYRLLEIEMDGLFKKMLLLKKKKYAALIVEEKDGKQVVHLEKKGLDIVRRDWCNLSHDVSEFILQQIFSDEPREDMLSKINEHLAKVGEDVKNGLYPIEKFTINKGLTKNPEDYGDAKNLPHVAVALSLKKKGVNVGAGETVPYVIVVGEESGLGARARHPDELRAADTPLKLDYQYYLANQVLPPVARLLTPLEGTDQARIAEILGLDANKFRSATDSNDNNPEEDLYTLNSTISFEERFKDVNKFMITCQNCSVPFEFQLVRVTHDEEGTHVNPGIMCTNVDCGVECDSDTITNQIGDEMTKQIMRYMSNMFVCDERTCGIRTKAIGAFAGRCPRTGCKGALVREYSHKMLETQLLYYTHIFNSEHTVKNFKYSNDILDLVIGMSNRYQAYTRPAHDVVQLMITRNARRFVDMGRLFQSMSLFI